MQGAQNFSQADITEAFRQHGIFDCAEKDISHRLNFSDKKEILSAVTTHGRQALENITKGGEVFYSRDSGLCTGPDEGFLRAVFLESSPHPPRDLLKYTGPSRIVIFLSAARLGQVGAVVVDSYSPFRDRALYQSSMRDDIVSGHRFSATMQRRTPLHVLRQHGRLEKRDISRLPKLVDSDWQGAWSPTTDLWDKFGLSEQVEASRTMASSIGQISINGGDYLRYLILVKIIESARLPISIKSQLTSMAHEVVGVDGHHFGSFRNAF